MDFIKKHKYIIIIILLIIIRFIMSFNLPSFYLRNLKYDDALMIHQTNSLLIGNYLGDYTIFTLIKGPIFPFLLALIRIIHISYSISFTILYILSCVYFTYSLNKIIKDKWFLLLIFAVILFNPISYSSDLFQRLYRNSISLTELLFFLGAVINCMFSNKHRLLNCTVLGIIISIMYLTREDTIWTLVVLFFMFIYKLYKHYKSKRKTNIVHTLILLFPIFILIISLNIISFINYNHYKIYTYNELKDSNFKTAYKKVLQIKDDEKIDKVAIPKSTFYKIVENSQLLKLTKEDVDDFFEKMQDENGEINNGNLVWYFRNMINYKYSFIDGEEANRFYKKLSVDIDNMFESGVLEKELVSPSVYMYLPTENEILDIPKSIFEAVIYTTSYDEVKTLSKRDLLSYSTTKYNEDNNVYSMSYKNYRKSANIPKVNPLLCEVIRVIYKIFTIILSPVALFIFFKNIKRKDKINVFSFITLICYSTIIVGIGYNNATAFPSIRYTYLANIYILQNIFILLNIYRLYEKKINNKKMKEKCFIE